MARSVNILHLQTVLCLNTSLTVFLSGLSRKGVPESELYSAAAAVVTAEFLKLIMCFLLLALTENGKERCTVCNQRVNDINIP